ncbi:uncharacterized protein LOC120504266 isoform X3 [Passer montanus]|uniref:uncharacterized protein LOC120504266 isoform X3 n=1 Tax=Passer montanus TaxID=9160 RepID=UPI00195F7869|nr:uncharacterized protein LOC120504266 isoform X3 [Passer montanus]
MRGEGTAHGGWSRSTPGGETAGPPPDRQSGADSAAGAAEPRVGLHVPHSPRARPPVSIPGQDEVFTSAQMFRTGFHAVTTCSHHFPFCTRNHELRSWSQQQLAELLHGG